jgi:EmrB/QacA subfamily drug resistance transporter
MPAAFDSTIVNVAIDAISHGLHTSVSNAQWTVSGYLLALAMAVPIAGWAMARFGGRATWMAALALFMAGSILSSLSWDMGALIAFRVIQGLGGGVMLPVLANLLVDAAGGRKLGRVMAAVGLPVLLGPILGPVVGALIIAHLSWRWIFWVNVPFAVTGLVLAWRRLEPGDANKGAYLDAVGLVLLSPALAALIYGLTEAGIRGGFGHSVVIIPLILGVALVGLFILHALSATRPPLLDVRLFKVRPFAASTAVLFLNGLGVYGALLLLPLYYQQLRGNSVLVAGLLLAPQGVGMLLTRSQAGKLTDKIGARPVVLAGLLLTGIGTIAYTRAGVHTNDALLALSLVIRGGGLSAVLIAPMATAYIGLTPGQVPHASTATRIAQQVGGSFGTAIIAMILQTQLAAHASAGIAGRVTAFDNTFWWSLAFTAIAVIPALGLPRQIKEQPGVAGEPSGDALLSGRLVELGEEPGQGPQVVFAEWGERSGVGDEVVPELVAQAVAFRGEDEGFDAAVSGVGLALERAAPDEPVDEGGEVGRVVVELPGQLAHRYCLAGGEPEQDLDLSGSQAERGGMRRPVLAQPLGDGEQHEVSVEDTREVLAGRGRHLRVGVHRASTLPVIRGFI